MLNAEFIFNCLAIYRQSLRDKGMLRFNNNTDEPLGTDTSLLRTVSNVPLKILIYFLQRRLSLIRTTDTKSRPQRVNSYKLNFFIMDTAVIR